MTDQAPIKPLSAVDCIRPAVNRTEKSLFTPFRWATWWRLALLGLATGEAASNGGCNFNGIGDLNKIGEAGKHSQQTDFVAAQHIPGISDGTVAALVAVLVVGVIVLVFVHLWVSSVARFMLLDAVATGRYRLRDGWKRWSSHGFRYFLFQLVMIVISLAILAVLIGVPLMIAASAGLFRDFQGHIGTFVLELVIFLPLFIICMIALAVFTLFVKDFAVPVMALEGITVMDAIRKVLGMAREKKGEFTVYVLMKIVLSVIVGIAMAIVIGIVMLVLIVPVVIALVGAGIAKPDIFQNPVAIAALVTVGLAALVPLIFLVGLISTPVVVFYQSYVLNFFGSRYAPLWVFMHPDGVPPASPPVEPMPGGHEPPPYEIVPPEPAG